MILPKRPRRRRRRGPSPVNIHHGQITTFNPDFDRVLTQVTTQSVSPPRPQSHHTNTAPFRASTCAQRAWRGLPRFQWMEEFYEAWAPMATRNQTLWIRCNCSGTLQSHYEGSQQFRNWPGHTTSGDVHVWGYHAFGNVRHYTIKVVTCLKI
jgi:hypothetical protein